MKSRNRIQVTCLCSAYKFPHRLGGGRCRGEEWAGSYFEVIKIECYRCAENSLSGCRVASGLESIKLCEGYRDFLHYQIKVRLPISLEDYCTNLIE